MTYEGFGVVTNSAGDMREPAKQLPRAMFLALGIVIVIYLVVSSVAITAAFVLFFPLAAVGQMASLAFLIVSGMVSVGHLRVYRESGAKRELLILAVVLNLALFLLLLGYSIHTGPASTWITLIAVLVASFVFEIAYRRPSRRARQATPDPGGSTPGPATRRR